MKLITISAFAFACLPSEAQANDFTFQGKPIRPECLEELHLAPVNLASAKCQSETKELDPQKLKEGLLGYGSIENPPTLYYKLLGKTHFQDIEKPDYFLIYKESAGGGTGQFTSLDIYKLEDGVLRLLDNLAGGDRCNGGVDNVELKDGVLIYKQNVTPYALYKLFQDQDGENAAFKDCASCCIGKVRYKGGKINTFEFNSVIINDLMVEKDTPQGCFDDIMNETIKAGKSLLTPDELKAFTIRVKEKCVLK